MRWPRPDVIVHDALVNADCLKLARSGALMEYAGKRGGKPSAQQRDISLRLLELARAGHRVPQARGRRIRSCSVVAERRR